MTRTLINPRRLVAALSMAAFLIALAPLSMAVRGHNLAPGTAMHDHGTVTLTAKATANSWKVKGTSGGYYFECVNVSFNDTKLNGEHQVKVEMKNGDKFDEKLTFTDGNSTSFKCGGRTDTGEVKSATVCLSSPVTKRPR